LFRAIGDLTGQGAVYLGLTPEITVLEVLVHLNGVLSPPLVLCRYDVPDTPGLINEPDPTALPKGWNAIHHGHASAGFGASEAVPAGSTADQSCQGCPMRPSPARAGAPTNPACLR
jgi:hypothetical protein